MTTCLADRSVVYLTLKSCEVTDQVSGQVRNCGSLYDVTFIIGGVLLTRSNHRRAAFERPAYVVRRAT